MKGLEACGVKKSAKEEEEEEVAAIGRQVFSTRVLAMAQDTTKCCC